jgi:hypothetical protein
VNDDWKRIVREQGPGVYRIAWRILGNADDADEVVQDVFLQAHQYESRNEVSNRVGLLKRLTVCRSLDGLRRRRADPSSGPEGTVLLRVRRNGRVDSAPDPDADKRPSQPDEFRFWIDPAREYLVMRMDMMGDGENASSSYIVESVAQSPQGHWYPTRVRRTSSRSDVDDQIMEFHVEFDVDIPDALFDVKQPLPVHELLQRTLQ